MRLKFIFLILLTLLLFSGAWFGFSRYSSKEQQEINLSSLPSIELSSLEGSPINLKDQIGNPLILIYFNSTCPICQSEAELIRKVFSEELKVTFIWVSSESLTEVRDFKNMYDFQNLPNHIFLSDTLFRFAGEFSLTTVPATLVYDSEGVLIKLFRGIVSMVDLKDAVSQAHENSR